MLPRTAPRCVQRGLDPAATPRLSELIQLPEPVRVLATSVDVNGWRQAGYEKGRPPDFVLHTIDKTARVLGYVQGSESQSSR